MILIHRLKISVSPQKSYCVKIKYLKINLVCPLTKLCRQKLRLKN